MFIDALETILRAEGAGGLGRSQGYKHFAPLEQEPSSWAAAIAPDPQGNKPRQCSQHHEVAFFISTANTCVGPNMFERNTIHF